MPSPPPDLKEQRRAAFIDMLRNTTESRMTTATTTNPPARKYNDERAEKLLMQLNFYTQAKGITQAKLAGILGIAGSSLSSLFGGKYAGDEDAHLTKIEQFLDRETERAEKPSITKFVETSVSRNIFKVLRQNHVHGTMGAVIAESGVGKTRSFLEYALKNENVILLTAAEWLRTQGQLSGKLAELLVVSKTARSMQARCEALVEKLRGASRLIVVDQAHQITERGHQFLQNLWDQCNPSDDERRVGIVFGCTWRFWTDIHAVNGTYWYEQLTSRMDAGTNVKIGTSPFKMADIEKLFAPDNIQFDLTAEGKEHLLRVANSPGGLRSAVANVGHLQHLLVLQKAPTTTKLTVDALQKTRALMLRSAA